MAYYQTEKQRLCYKKAISLYRAQHMGRSMIEKIIPVSKRTISDLLRKFVSENPKYMSIDMMTHREAAQRTGELRKHWTSYRGDAHKGKAEGDAYRRQNGEQCHLPCVISLEFVYFCTQSTKTRLKIK